VLVRSLFTDTQTNSYPDLGLDLDLDPMSSSSTQVLSRGYEDGFGMS